MVKLFSHKLLGFLLSAIGTMAQVTAAQELVFTVKVNLDQLHRIEEYDFLPEGLTEQMLTSLEHYPFTNQYYTILSFNDQTFAIKDGYFDIHIWKDGKWRDYHRNHYGGYNFRAKLFIYNNEIHSFGGYGYWRSHSDLIVYDNKENKWVPEIITGLPAFFQSFDLYHTNNSLYLFGGKFHHRPSGISSTTNQIYKIDLTSYKIKKLRTKPLIDLPVSTHLRGNILLTSAGLEDYFVIYAARGLIEEGFYVFDKQKNTLHFVGTETSRLSYSPLSMTHGNIFSYYEVGFKEARTIDFTGLTSTENQIARIVPDYRSVNRQLTLIIAGLVLLLFPWILIYRQHKRMKQLPQHSNASDGSNNNTIELITLLLGYGGEVFDTDKLDQIFRIDGMENFDQKRVKRARIIQEVNTLYKLLRGHDLIVRQRNEQDKRFMNYLIAKDRESLNKR